MNDIKSLVKESPLENNYYNIDEIINYLKSLGWSSDDLERNELYSSSFKDAITSPNFVKFWETIDEACTLFHENKFEPLLIKCIRTYPYFDKNVDVIVPKGKWKEFVKLVTGSKWYMPSMASRLDQLLIERGKLKFPSHGEHFMMIHLYKFVSWRYQSDMELLRDNGTDPELNQISKFEANMFSEDVSSKNDSWFYHPNRVSELVVQAAHVVFENYRITLGEVINFQILKRDKEAWDNACELSKEYGCYKALIYIDQLSQNILSDIENLKPSDFPYRMKYSDLSECFQERVDFWKERNNTLTGYKEMLTSKLFFGILQPVRSFRKLRKGTEAYRRP